MFKNYYLVEITASNKVQSIRSNCVLTTWKWQKPPLELAYQNCIELGYSVINVLSVNKVSKKTANWLKEYINRKPKEVKVPVDQIMGGIFSNAGGSNIEGDPDKE